MRIVSDKLLCHGNGPGNRNDVECVLVCIKRPIRRQIQMQMQMQMRRQLQIHRDTWIQSRVCEVIEGGDFKESALAVQRLKMPKNGIELWHIVQIPLQIRNTFEYLTHHAHRLQGISATCPPDSMNRRPVFRYFSLASKFMLVSKFKLTLLAGK